MKTLVVGLGNPGMEGTRHNIGADILIKAFDLSGKISAKDDYLFLICPSVMNISGEVVSKTYRYYRCEKCIVVADDLNSKFGVVKYKDNTTSGGHNGIKSIKQYIANFQQIRIGIGRPESKEEVSGFVLGSFSYEEKENFDNIIDNFKEVWKSNIG
jgi:PTH1 family peptidyl-tRNA hydrolase